MHFEASRGLLIQMQNISCKVQGCAESKPLRLVFGFESDRAVLTFTFLASLFFSFAGHLVGFILVGKVFRKAFRILAFTDESRGRWALEQHFQGNFSGQCYLDFCLFLRCP